MADCRREHRAEDGHDDVRSEDDRHGRRPGDRKRTGREREGAADDEAALGMRRVDQRSDRRVQQDADHAADRQHGADGRLVPMRLRQQKDADMRSKPAAHVRQQEIQPIERGSVRHSDLGGGHVRAIARDRLWNAPPALSCADERPSCRCLPVSSLALRKLLLPLGSFFL